MKRDDRISHRPALSVSHANAEIAGEGWLDSSKEAKGKERAQHHGGDYRAQASIRY